MAILFDCFCAGDGETMDEFEERLFGRKGTDEGSLYAKLDRAENAGRRYNMGSGMGGFTGFSDRSRSGSSMGGFPGFGDRSSSGLMGGFDSLHDSLSDKLANVARNFQMEEEDDDEGGDWEDDFEFRSDVPYKRGSTYSVRVSSILVCQYIARIIGVI
jgi:hypothetical protein